MVGLGPVGTRRVLVMVAALAVVDLRPEPITAGEHGREVVTAAAQLHTDALRG